jgi:hypothetical protein
MKIKQKKNKMKIFAKTISLFFHPLLITIYSLAAIYFLHPFIFDSKDDKSKIIFITYTILSTFILPVLAIILMKNLNIIETFKMEKKTERIGPLIVVSMLYLWLFINFKNSTELPLDFAALMLGASLAVMSAFFINNFIKISLHTLGMGSVISLFLILKYNLEYSGLSVKISTVSSIDLSLDFLIILVIVLAGIVGSSRLFLKAHTEKELYLGYIVGFITQFIAFNIIL